MAKLWNTSYLYWCWWFWVYTFAAKEVLEYKKTSRKTISGPDIVGWYTDQTKLVNPSCNSDDGNEKQQIPLEQAWKTATSNSSWSKHSFLQFHGVVRYLLLPKPFKKPNGRSGSPAQQTSLDEPRFIFAARTAVSVVWLWIFLSETVSQIPIPIKSNTSIQKVTRVLKVVLLFCKR